MHCHISISISPSLPLGLPLPLRVLAKTTTSCPLGLASVKPILLSSPFHVGFAIAYVQPPRYVLHGSRDVYVHRWPLRRRFPPFLPAPFLIFISTPWTKCFAADHQSHGPISLDFQSPNVAGVACMIVAIVPSGLSSLDGTLATNKHRVLDHGHSFHSPARRPKMAFLRSRHLRSLSENLPTPMRTAYLKPTTEYHKLNCYYQALSQTGLSCLDWLLSSSTLVADLSFNFTACPCSNQGAHASQNHPHVVAILRGVPGDLLIACVSAPYIHLLQGVSVV